MMSLRSIARSVPRTTGRLINVSSRPCRSAVLSHASLKPATPLRIASAFSTSRPQLDNRPELVEKLNEEMAVEQEQQSQDNGIRDECKQYLDNSEFQLEDIPGSQEVALTRTYGDEKIRVVFSLADFNQPPDAESSEDDALYDEDMPEEGQSGGGNTKGAINQGRVKGGNFQIAPEDDIAPADRDEFRNDNEVQGGSFPARVYVHVTRQGKGALTISCIADGGELEIEDVSAYTKPELADAKTAENEFAGRNLYTGPPYGDLDEHLQELLESYLEERGINTAMAVFIPAYIDMKEQKEYVRWLGNMKNFFE
ncbi:hypothetical protein MBLNU457_g2816t1 [Dothideomycetes sp. NU457]